MIRRACVPPVSCMNNWTVCVVTLSNSRRTYVIHLFPYRHLLRRSLVRPGSCPGRPLPTDPPRLSPKAKPFRQHPRYRSSCPQASPAQVSVDEAASYRAVFSWKAKLRTREGLKACRWHQTPGGKNRFHECCCGVEIGSRSLIQHVDRSTRWLLPSLSVPRSLQNGREARAAACHARLPAPLARGGQSNPSLARHRRDHGQVRLRLPHQP